MFTSLNEVEIKALDFIAENIVNPIATPILKVITHLGDAGIFWIILAAALLFFPKTRKAGLCMSVALICCLVLGNLTLKPLLARTRPYDFIGKLDLLVPAESDFSFPSGHTLSSFAAATALFLNYKKWGIAALALAALIALSRLYFYLHYPTDVIAGFVLGIALGVFACFAVSYICRKITEKKAKSKE